MRSAREQVLELLAAGKISSDEAEELLGALAGPRRPLWQWLFVPMELLSTRTALLCGLAATAVALAVARAGVRFDGAFDVHLGSWPGWTTAVLEQLVAWPMTAGVLWASGRIARPGLRGVDALAAVGLARVPLVLFALVAVAVGAPSASADPLELRVVVLALFAVLLLAWTVALLVTGFRAASGLHGARLAAHVVPALLVAELLSKGALMLLPP